MEIKKESRKFWKKPKILKKSQKFWKKKSKILQKKSKILEKKVENFEIKSKILEKKVENFGKKSRKFWKKKVKNHFLISGAIQFMNFSYKKKYCENILDATFCGKINNFFCLFG